MSLPRPMPARFVVAVGSGKGGVGKSTVALNLALALAERKLRVGLLDADVYGPNIPLMLNLARTKRATGWMLWRNPEVGGHRIEPVETHGLRIMSAGFIVAEDQSLSWDAGLVGVLIRQLLFEVEWGELDYLIIDLPPGTGDIQQSIIQATTLSGVVLVVTPQDVAHLDARRAVEMLQRLNVPILGAVENMAGLACPHCHEHIDVFHPVADARAIWSTGITKLGEIPLRPDVSRNGDAGHPVILSQTDTPHAWAFRQVADRIASTLEN